MTTRSRLIAAAGLLLIVVAFLGGFWPQRQRRVALEAEIGSLRARVEGLDDHARLARLHGQLLDLTDAIAAMNYGQAQTLSSRLFDNVRAEASRTRNPDYRAALETMLAIRDEITAALAKGDPAALEPLRRTERQLRQMLAASPTVEI